MGYVFLMLPIAAAFSLCAVLEVILSTILRLRTKEA
jgi:hypothetical protein